MLNEVETQKAYEKVNKTLIENIRRENSKSLSIGKIVDDQVDALVALDDLNNRLIAYEEYDEYLENNVNKPNRDFLSGLSHNRRSLYDDITRNFNLSKLSVGALLNIISELGSYNYVNSDWVDNPQKAVELNKIRSNIFNFLKEATRNDG